MSDRGVDGFFYGLFMDAGVLTRNGIEPTSPRPAYVDGYTLRLGARATLVPDSSGRAYGMLFALTHNELDALYTAPGLEAYRPEALLAHPLAGGAVPALCYNLPELPAANERNADYAAQLRAVLSTARIPAGLCRVRPLARVRPNRHAPNTRAICRRIKEARTRRRRCGPVPSSPSGRAAAVSAPTARAAGQPSGPGGPEITQNRDYRYRPDVC